MLFCSAPVGFVLLIAAATSRTFSRRGRRDRLARLGPLSAPVARSSSVNFLREPGAALVSALFGFSLAAGHPGARVGRAGRRARLGSGFDPRLSAFTLISRGERDSVLASRRRCAQGHQTSIDLEGGRSRGAAWGGFSTAASRSHHRSWACLLMLRRRRVDPHSLALSVSTPDSNSLRSLIALSHTGFCLR